MPLLSIRIIKRPIKERYCCVCNYRIYGETIRLYGMMDYGEKPQNFYLHRACITGKDTLKKLAEIEAAK